MSVDTFNFNCALCMHAALVAVIVVGVAVVISLCVLVIGLVIIRRYIHDTRSASALYTTYRALHVAP